MKKFIVFRNMTMFIPMVDDISQEQVENQVCDALADLGAVGVGYQVSIESEVSDEKPRGDKVIH